MQHADGAFVQVLLGLGCAVWILTDAAPARAQIGERVAEVVIEQEGQLVTEPTITRLIQTRVGEPLSMADVRETIDHLMSLRRFDDVQPSSEPMPNGVRLRYMLFPLHPIDRIDFRGTLGLSEGALRSLVVDRFGDSPRPGQVGEITDMLRSEYRRKGYDRASITPRVVESHDPDRATLVIDVEAGPRQTITDVRPTQVDPERSVRIQELPDVKRGQPFDEDAIEQELRAWEERMRARDYYEANASHGASITGEGVFVTVNLALGPRVVLRFTGDPLPESERERLVPIRAEGSADEDLLEDSRRAIETYFHARGYRDAAAPVTREERGGDLIITFDIDRGPRYILRSVTITGNAAVSTAELLPFVKLESGQPLVETTLSARIESVRSLYRVRGFRGADVKTAEMVLVPEVESLDRQTDVTIQIAEGLRTVVGAVTFEGNAALDQATLRSLTAIAPGQAFSDAELVQNRDGLELEYRNRGYDGVVVTPAATFSADGTRADVVFRLREGPQAIVDHIIIVGNRRISTDVIERELLLREGQPLGYTTLIESRARLVALGLFRRIQIEPLPHGGEGRRDVLVEVEESDATVLDLGGGVEGRFLLRTGAGGLAEEHFELAPRGYFQIGRRNLWGKNRTANLFTRVSLSSRQDTTAPISPIEAPEVSYGFHEYRVWATFREPRAFNTRAEVLFSAIIEQAIRSSFDFNRREVRAEAGLRLSPVYTLSGLYSLQNTKLFNVDIAPEDEPIIDRLFPRVRIGKVSGSIIRDSRDDPLDASRGSLFIVSADLAARALGSEVGFVKTFAQGFFYQQLPSPRRLILALGARVGAAHGFLRKVGGAVVQDLPASERFFAGGDTSVRGFSLDRLGDERTITTTGFPTGGNGVVVLNSELRFNLTSTLQTIGFLDAGNVFPKASDLSVIDMRPAAGFGLMYRSPFGPVRVDLGFNLDPQEFVPGVTERGNVLHILFGQAF
jgi:outer membrane protein insertion porin family